MGDRTTETLELESRRHELSALGLLLGEQDLYLDDDAVSLILNHIDYFISLCRVNKSVEHVFLCRNASVGDQDEDVWDKVGEAIGNLQALKALQISLPREYYVEEEDGDYELFCRGHGPSKLRSMLLVMVICNLV
jgi:hypothetical protein